MSEQQHPCFNGSARMNVAGCAEEQNSILCGKPFFGRQGAHLALDLLPPPHPQNPTPLPHPPSAKLPNQTMVDQDYLTHDINIC